MNIDFDSACSFESLLAAYRRARRASPGSEDTRAFGWRLEENLLALREDLLGGRYRHGPYREFIVMEAKKRHIRAASFRDRVVHQAVHAVLEPVFERGFIGDSYACRRGKGTHAALARIESWLRRSGDCYVLSCDISKYFASIDHARLMRLIERRVRDERLLGLCRLLVESSEDAPGRGVPIGNLTSQLFANIYLNVLDQYAKRSLGIRRYVRYMDDFLVFGKTATALHETKRRFACFLESELRLVLHPKKAQVFPILPGVPFLGYRLFRHHRRLRGLTVKRYVRRTRTLARETLAGVGGSGEALTLSVHSWLPYATAARSRGLRAALSARLGVAFSGRAPGSIISMQPITV